MDENCFRISKQEPTGDLNFYTLQKNRFPCNSALCLVQCERCPKGIACAHEYTCTCQQYAYRNSCKHSHILMLSERLTPNAVSDCDDRASSISADDRVKTVAGPVFVDGVETVGEALVYVAECVHMEEEFAKRMRAIKNTLKSDNINTKEKRLVMESMREPFRSIVNTPLSINPGTLPSQD
ncbi:hypothetical protein TCAL_15803 [Tigriopus californicus]|uniref:SWIM-type domain-containing protein n=1 Tax=Tigriopus californicus TaxID=6832 RepID=A0A553NQJ1_TIGCA|nr:hypothetical protein TCAL_15803 [Tigriopus californicus]